MKAKTNSKMNIVKMALVSGAIALSASAQASLLIDDFDAPLQVVHTSFNPGPITAAAAVIGGQRTIEATVVGSGATQAGLFGILAPVPGVYDHAQAINTTGTSTITWDAAGGGLGGIDAASAGTSFVIDILSIDQGNVDFTFTVIDTNGGISTASLFGADVGLENVNFADFSGTANFALLDSISLELSAGSASDAAIDSIYIGSVPLPAAIWMLGGGLAGLAAFSRRRKV